MDIKNLIIRNKRSLYERKKFTAGGLPVHFAGAGKDYVRLRSAAKGIAKDPEFAIDQLNYFPYSQLPDDFVGQVKEVLGVDKKETDDRVEAVDISFFKGQV